MLDALKFYLKCNALWSDTESTEQRNLNIYGLSAFLVSFYAVNNHSRLACF